MILKLYIKVENAGMVEQVDTQDLKSCESNLVRVRFPFLVQKPRPDTIGAGLLIFLEKKIRLGKQAGFTSEVFYHFSKIPFKSAGEYPTDFSVLWSPSLKTKNKSPSFS